MRNQIIIRKFKNQDRNFIRKIACDTAFMGEPCEIFFKGRDFLADLLTAYFTDYEPESCFIAEIDGKVAGYLTGTKNIKEFNKVFAFKLLPKLIFYFFFKGIILSKKNMLFFFNLFRSMVRGELKSPDINKEYPAMLHINIEEHYRKMNIGTRLIENYLNYLQSENIMGVHLNVKSMHASIFFEKMGFKKICEVKRTYFFYLLNKPFIYYYYAKNIATNSS